MQWKPLPKAPIRGRIGEGVVWTGTEMIVWGGIDRSEGPGPVDGAAYNPRTRRWRKLPPAPGSMRGVVESAVWTGKEAFFWTGDWATDANRGAALYDPRTNTWRSIGRGPLGGRQGSSTVWTGHEAIIVSGVTGDNFPSPVAAAVDLPSGRWRQISALDRLPGLVVSGVWSGRRAYLFGNRYLCPELASGCRKARRIFLEYDPRHDSLRRLSVAGAPRNFFLPVSSDQVVWDRGLILFDRNKQRIVRYSPTSGEWSAGPPGKCPKGFGEAAWAGRRYVAGCGTKSVHIFDPASDTWRALQTSGSPLSNRFGSAIVWTGSELIVWSGSLDEKHNPMTDDGRSVRLPD